LSKYRDKAAAQAKQRNRVIVEPLEPRTLFSADVVSASLALDLIDDSSQEPYNWPADNAQPGFSVSDSKGFAYPPNDSEVRNRTDSSFSVGETGNNSRGLIGFEEQASDVLAEIAPDYKQSRQLIIIDARVDDGEALLEDVINNGQSGTDFEIIQLADDSDGIEQITLALSADSNQKYDAVHIIAHGSDAELLMGSTQLNSGNLQNYQNEFSSWQTGMSLNADILLYGCDVAQTDHGQDFVDQISLWTGADLASSTDLTGHADLGGNWELEYTVGTIETDLAFSTDAQHN